MKRTASNDNGLPVRLAPNGRVDILTETLLRVLVRRALIAEGALPQAESDNSRQRAA